MSRIGRALIAIPAGVDVTLGEDNVVTVKGPLGTLTQKFSSRISIVKEGSEIKVSRSSEDKLDRSLHGLTRTLISNMVIGVKDGYKKTLEIVGVGYRAEKSGKSLNLNLGFSHPVVFEEADGITFEVPNPNTVVVKGIDKQMVGEIAAKIRSKRPPEPYLGKGVKYAGERIRRKAGKAGK
ncbi:MAG: 50S ribosomal protein L6 [Clostridiales bacterium]|nr:50S ribosomal protein L6 [Clostridiales bacterium]